MAFFSQNRCFQVIKSHSQATHGRSSCSVCLDRLRVKPIQQGRPAADSRKTRIRTYGNAAGDVLHLHALGMALPLKTSMGSPQAFCMLAASIGSLLQGCTAPPSRSSLAHHRPLACPAYPRTAFASPSCQQPASLGPQDVGTTGNTTYTMTFYMIYTRYQITMIVYVTYVYI